MPGDQIRADGQQRRPHTVQRQPNALAVPSLFHLWGCRQELDGAAGNKDALSDDHANC